MVSTLSDRVSDTDITANSISSSKQSRWSAKGRVHGLSMLLFLVAVGCYFPSLWAGFAGDDFFAYSYFFRALDNDPLSLTKNLVAPWMSCILRELHYRPFMLVPHLFDCLVWRFNPVGFHLTNVVIHGGCTVLVFLIARKLLGSFDLYRGLIVPFFAGLLFAVHPLHAEAVSWVAGRVDSFCALLYFSSFLFFLQARESQSRALMSVSCMCAFASMLCKEIGAVLPVVLTLYCLCAGTPGANVSVVQSCKRAFKVTLPFWSMLLVYLCARTASLGTFVGGYAGMTGVLFDTTWQWRLFRIESYEKLVLPIPFEMNQQTNFYFLTLSCLCILMVSISLLRMWLGKAEPNLGRAAIFWGGWLLVQFAVVSRVWNATAGLAGGRQFYLLSAPLFILITLLLIENRSRFLKLSGSGLCLLYCAVLSVITFQQNAYWKEMSDYSREFQQAVTTYLKDANWTGRIQVANVPVTHRHLCMTPSFEVLKALFAVPFCAADLSDRICSREPYFYNNNLLNKTMLSMSLADPTTKVVCWNDADKSVRPLSCPPVEGVGTSCRLELISNKDNIATYRIFAAQPISKGALDCVEITMSSTCTQDNVELQNRPGVLAVSWTDCLGATERDRLQGILWEIAEKDGSQHLVKDDHEEKLSSTLAAVLDPVPVKKYRLHLSQVASWVLGGELCSLQLSVAAPAAESSPSYKIKSVRLLNLADEIPVVTLNSAHWSRNSNGTYTSLDKASYVFEFDARRLKSAERVVAEVSLPDQYWYHFESSYRQRKLSTRRLASIPIKGMSGTFQLSRELFPESADYQIRIAGLMPDGEPAGYVSDPLTIRVEAQNPP